jgi:hypothetical protein
VAEISLNGVEEFFPDLYLGGPPAGIDLRSVFLHRKMLGDFVNLDQP